MINTILIFPTLSIFEVVRQPRLTVIEKASLFLCEPDRLLPGQAIYLRQHFIHFTFYTDRNVKISGISD